MQRVPTVKGAICVSVKPALREDTAQKVKLQVFFSFRKCAQCGQSTSLTSTNCTCILPILFSVHILFVLNKPCLNVLFLFFKIESRFQGKKKRKKRTVKQS